jgi:CRP-like cAMP-binding protein
MLIKHVDVFKTLAAEDVDTLVEGSTEKLVAEGEHVFSKDDLSDSLYIIKRGVIAIYRNGDKLAELYDGEMFGEMGVLDEKKRAADAIAEKPTQLILISKKLLHSVIDGRMSIEMKIRRKILERHSANISHALARD